MVRALGLLSGGLDSLLACRVIMDQGIAVTGMTFCSPFFGAEHAQVASVQLGIPLIIENITEQHIVIVKNPPHGYGQCMNPCIDCHALMLAYAGRVMQKQGYDFIFTGEVLNERPMSQNRRSLALVAQLSGYSEYVLRPLSALLLPVTRPEETNLVDRSRLLDLQGRSRRRQIALADHYALTVYPTPAGGCLLTDPRFSERLKDLLTYEHDPSIAQIHLLKIGRHFRLSDTVKLVIGRNEAENRIIETSVQEYDILLSAEHIPGPVAIVSGKDSHLYIEQAAAFCAYYSDARTQGVPASVFEILDGVQITTHYPSCPERAVLEKHLL